MMSRNVTISETLERLLDQASCSHNNSFLKITFGQNVAVRLDFRANLVIISGCYFEYIYIRPAMQLSMMKALCRITHMDD